MAAARVWNSLKQFFWHGTTALLVFSVDPLMFLRYSGIEQTDGRTSATLNAATSVGGGHNSGYGQTEQLGLSATHWCYWYDDVYAVDCWSDVKL